MKKLYLAALAFGFATSVWGDESAIYGKWVPSEYQCTYDGYVSDSVFTIDRDAVRFFESSCDILGGQYTGVGEAYSLTMECYGEGEAWTQSVIYARTDVGLMVYFEDGYGYMAKPCR